MKILIVINDYLNKTNGMSISTQRFVNEFKMQGHDVRIITNKRYGELDYPLDILRIPVLGGVIEKEGYTFAKVNRKMIREAIAWADVVHLEDPFLVCRRAGIEAQKMNKPVTGSFHLYPENMTYAFHCGHAHVINFRLMRSFLKFVYNRCDYIHCPTEDVKHRLKNYRNKSHLEVISNGISPFFLNQERSREFDGTLNILSVGRYAAEKKQKVLIKAIAESRHKDQIKVRIAGQGPLEDNLKKLAKKKGVSVEFGFLNHEDLRKAMLDADLYIHCANVEVEGMSCMEAFGCGAVPIIAKANLSSTKAYALHDCNVFGNGDYRELAEKIDYFFENPEEIKKLSKEYMEYGSSLNISNCAGKLLDMMERAVAEKNN